MWLIARVDANPYTQETTYFEVQAAYRKRDLDPQYARKSGFVGPSDELVVISPNGKISKTQEA
jgi:hypothetical protein